MAETGVEAVERALRILDAFGNEEDRLELRQIAVRTALNKATILRLAVSLEKFNYLRRDERGRFALGPTLWRLGARYRRSFDIADLVRPVIARLSSETGETAAFYVRAGDGRICLYRVNSPRSARHHVEEGDVLPLEYGSGGLVLLAFDGANGERFENIRSQGYCLSRGERDADVSGVAAPVLEVGGRLVGALLLSGLNSRFDEQRAKRLTTAVVEAARQLSHRLGARIGERETVE